MSHIRKDAWCYVGIIVIVIAAVVIGYCIYIWASGFLSNEPYTPLEPSKTEQPTVIKLPSDESIVLLYSEDKSVVLVFLPRGTKLINCQDAILKLYTEGYEYMGSYQIDNGVAAAHFDTYLIFKKIGNNND